MRRLRFLVAYDGTGFHGWQVQPGLATIQGTLEEIISGMEGRPVHVAGSGRTDAGVHAYAQVAAVSIQNPIPPDNFRRAVNRLLPKAIRVSQVEEVPLSFHPQFQARRKTVRIQDLPRRDLLPFRSQLRLPPSVSVERGRHGGDRTAVRRRARFHGLRRLR